MYNTIVKKRCTFAIVRTILFRCISVSCISVGQYLHFRACFKQYCRKARSTIIILSNIQRNLVTKTGFYNAQLMNTKYATHVNDCFELLVYGFLQTTIRYFLFLHLVCCTKHYYFFRDSVIDFKVYRSTWIKRNLINFNVLVTN